MQPETQKENSGSILVVGGKGGVGKTSVSAMMVKLLIKHHENLLVIDADPVSSLIYALGEKPEKTIGNYRECVISSTEEQRAIFKRPLKTIIKEMVAKSPRGYDLLAMGRSEGKGCFCGINDMLRYSIEQLCAEYATTLIDCEAGIEQVNRRAVHHIDKLLLVADTSRRGIAALVQIRDIATKYNEDRPISVNVVVNRVRDEKEEKQVREIAQDFGLNVIGCIPEDSNVREYNLGEKPLLDLPDDSPAIRALNDIVKKLYAE